MLKINKKLTTIIYNINLSKKIIKEINNFFADEIKPSTKHININNTEQCCSAEDYTQVSSLSTMVDWIEEGEYQNCYISSKQYLIKRLNKIIEFCREKEIKYVWTI